MENIDTLKLIGATVLGCLFGLYLYGRHLKKTDKIKVQGTDVNDLLNKLSKASKKIKVKFEKIQIFSYEQLVKWVNETDLKDATSQGSNYCCLLIRGEEEISNFNIELSDLSKDEKEHMLGVMIIKTSDNSIIKQRWIVANAIDQDLQELFGNNNSIIIK